MSDRTVYRLRGIPLHFDRLETRNILTRYFKDDDNSGSSGGGGGITASQIYIYSHEKTFHSSRPATKTATLMFTQTPATIVNSLPGSKHQWTLNIPALADPLVLDTHFFGITKLYDVEQRECRCNIVAISGLASHPFSSWQPGDDKTFITSFQSSTDLALTFIGHLDASFSGICFSRKMGIFWAFETKTSAIVTLHIVLASSGNSEDTSSTSTQAKGSSGDEAITTGDFAKNEWRDLLHALNFEELDSRLDGVEERLQHIFEWIYDPALASVLNPLTKAYRRRDREKNPWTIRELELCFKLILEQKRENIRIFFLFDALDEYDGPPEFIGGSVRNLADMSLSDTRVKVCFSSRSWNSFMAKFKEFPSIQVQDFTVDDIQSYCEKSFEKLDAGVCEELDPLVPGILRRADGVFLWCSRCQTFQDICHKVEQFLKRHSSMHGYIDTDLLPPSYVPSHVQLSFTGWYNSHIDVFMHQTVRDFVLKEGFSELVLERPRSRVKENGFTILAKTSLAWPITPSWLSVATIWYLAEQTTGCSLKGVIDSVEIGTTASTSNLGKVGIRKYTIKYFDSMAFAVERMLFLYIKDTLKENPAAIKTAKSRLMHIPFSETFPITNPSEGSDSRQISRSRHILPRNLKDVKVTGEYLLNTG
ncbi:hypothetical protein B0T22DRAFT_441000 [Podospora appendiculata]|uniref:Vegetative incompatibility protein HET-E-1 n=1 Tax=Podospora appendiculata TaxID=314037 RepID=A0AAE1CDE5_9PEZI|nr:hypothetical protein B0T22DRAFT_441000 [Podospora appendiculata]